MKTTKIIIGVVMVGAILGVVFSLNYTTSIPPSEASEITSKYTEGCVKWIGIAALAKQDFPHFLDEALEMGKKKCGFDIDRFI